MRKVSWKDLLRGRAIYWNCLLLLLCANAYAQTPTYRVSKYFQVDSNAVQDNPTNGVRLYTNGDSLYAVNEDSLVFVIGRYPAFSDSARVAFKAYRDSSGQSIVNMARTITVAGTANQITSSAGAQDLSANRTWTLSTPQDIHTGATNFTVAGATIVNPSNKRGLTIWDGTNLGSKIGFNNVTTSPTEPYLVHNVSYTGSWVVDDAAVAAHAFQFGSGGAFLFASQSSGSGTPPVIATIAPTAATFPYMTTDGGVVRTNSSGTLATDQYLTYLSDIFAVGSDSSVSDQLFDLYNRQGFYARLSSMNVTADRIFLFPDTAGTLATQQHVGTFYVPLASRFYWHKSGSATKNDSLRFIEGSGVTLTQTNNTLTIAASGGSGDIEGVTAGDGLGGGGTSGTVTVTANVLTNGGLTIVSDSLRVDTTKIATPYDLSLYKKVDFEGTTDVTHSLTTVASEEVAVWAKGWADIATGTSGTIYLKYNSVTKDQVDVSEPSGAGGSGRVPFALMYFETPGAATQNITVESSTGDVVVTNVKIMVQRATP